MQAKGWWLTIDNLPLALASGEEKRSNRLRKKSQGLASRSPCCEDELRVDSAGKDHQFLRL